MSDYDDQVRIAQKYMFGAMCILAGIFFCTGPPNIGTFGTLAIGVGIILKTWFRGW